MAINNMVNTKQTLDPKKDKKKSIFSYLTRKSKTDFSKFDPDTGEKIAFQNNTQTNPKVNKPFGNIKNLKLAKQEALADARQTKSQPVDWFHALKAGTVGTSGGFVASQLLGKSGRTAGLMSLGLGAAIAGLDTKRQLSDYNKQMAARELIAGKRTSRSKAYYNNLVSKYSNNG